MQRTRNETELMLESFDSNAEYNMEPRNKMLAVYFFASYLALCVAIAL